MYVKQAKNILMNGDDSTSNLEQTFLIYTTKRGGIVTRKSD